MLWQDAILNIGLMVILAMCLWLMSLMFSKVWHGIAFIALGVAFLGGALAMKPISHFADTKRCHEAGGELFQGKCVDAALFKKITQ